MAKVAVKPKSQPLYEALRDKGLKKKKAAKIANGFVVTKRGDTSSSPNRRSTAKSRPNRKKRSSSRRTKSSKRR